LLFKIFCFKKESVDKNGELPRSLSINMQDREKINKVVFRAVDELNDMLPQENRLQKSVETALMGESGKLDSLGFVNFILAVEDEFEKEYGFHISLTDIGETSQKENPFQTIGTLIEYITFLAEGNI
jgi:acyl carrier protein